MDPSVPGAQERALDMCADHSRGWIGCALLELREHALGSRVIRAYERGQVARNAVDELDMLDAVQAVTPAADLPAARAVHLQVTEARRQNPARAFVGLTPRVARSGGPHQSAVDLDPPFLQPPAASDPSRDQ